MTRDATAAEALHSTTVVKEIKGGRHATNESCEGTCSTWLSEMVTAEALAGAVV